MDDLPQEVGVSGSPRRVLEFSDVSDSNDESHAAVKGNKRKTKDSEDAKPSVVSPTGERESYSLVSWRYRNTPTFIDSLLQNVLRRHHGGKKFRGQGEISHLNSRVMRLPHLKMCPNKNNQKTCHCVEMSHGAMVAFQDDVRTLYCRIIQQSSRQMGNKFLMELMVPSQQQANFGLRFKVPCFTFDERVRIFYLCRSQFCALFGLSTKKW